MKPIFTALEPNTRFAEAMDSFTMVMRPWSWFKGGAPAKIEKWFMDRYSVSHAVTLDSARSGLYLILRSLEVGEGDEVILQAFTCVAVTNPILWCGAAPRYVDIEEGTLNMSIEKLESAITPNTKAIIVQHTFGYPAEIAKILEIARKNDLAVIEDCAHTIGGKADGTLLGTFGDAAIFSFGRDKSISGVAGGIVITNREDIGKYIPDQRNGSHYPPMLWVKKQLLHPFLTYVIKQTYNFLSIGKLLHKIALSIGIIAKASTKEEKQCAGRPPFMPGKLANGLATLAYHQLQEVDTLNDHRKGLQGQYDNIMNYPGISRMNYGPGEYALLRYSIKMKNGNERNRLLEYAKTKNIYLDTWYDTPVAPADVNLEAAGYAAGSCPVAEDVGKRIINLPINSSIGKEEVSRIKTMLDNFFEAGH